MLELIAVEFYFYTFHRLLLAIFNKCCCFFFVFIISSSFCNVGIKQVSQYSILLAAGITNTVVFVIVVVVPVCLPLHTLLYCSGKIKLALTWLFLTYKQ